MRRLKTIVALVAAGTLISSAALADSAPRVMASALPPPDAPQVSLEAARDSRIGVQDTLEISVFEADSLTKTVQVDNGGQIDLPLIGEVTAAGKTPRELERDVAARLDKGNYVEAPQVTVLVKDSASQKFTVEGAVKLSGVFPLQGQMTLLRAIATAQGVDGDANQRDVVIFRTVNQQRVAGVIDLGRVRAGKIDDPKIYPGDTVVVMTSKSRRALKDLIGLAPLFFLFTLI